MFTTFINTVLINNRNNVLLGLVAFFLALQCIFLMTMAHPQNLISDRDSLISLSKKIQSESKVVRDLDNMDVRIYKEDKYIVVYFSPKQKPGRLIAGGDVAYYFIKKESGGYQFIKCVLGQ